MSTLSSSKKLVRHPDDVMKKACMEVILKGRSKTYVSQEFGIPRSTLRRYLLKCDGNIENMTMNSFQPNYSVNRIFNDDEEQKFYDYLQESAKHHFGFSTNNVRKMAYELALKYDKKIPEAWKANNMAGRKWLKGFRKRRREISLRTPEATEIMEMDPSRKEESVYDHASLISEDVDASSSLGENSTKLDDSSSEVVSISGESSTSGDLFDASTEDNNKSMNEQSVISIRESSESDGEKEADKDLQEVKMDTALLNKEEECDPNKTVKQETSHTPTVDDDIDNHIKSDAPPKQERATPIDANETSPMVKIFKFPTMPVLKSLVVLPPGESPSAKGILKRQSTISIEMLTEQSLGNRRRVSFAEPISKCKRVETIPPDDSPSSSLMHFPRVSRRLSLQPDKKSDDMQVSTLSLQSIHVAEAIAHIKAEDSNSPSRLLNADKYRTHPSGGEEINLRSISVKDLESPEFLKSLSKAQLKDIFTFLLNTMPVLHNALLKAFDT